MRQEKRAQRLASWVWRQLRPPSKVRSLPSKHMENKLCSRDVLGILLGCPGTLGVREVVQIISPSLGVDILWLVSVYVVRSCSKSARSDSFLKIAYICYGAKTIRGAMPSAMTGYPQNAFGESSATVVGDCHYARPPRNLFLEGISLEMIGKRWHTLDIGWDAEGPFLSRPFRTHWDWTHMRTAKLFVIAEFKLNHFCDSRK